MQRKPATVLAILGAIVAVSAPAMLGLHLSRSQAIEAEMEYVREVARDALRRSEAASDQLDVALTRLAALGGDDHCSPEHLAEMKRIDLGFNALQIVGRVLDNTLVCSSISGGNGAPELPLGPLDHLTPRGTGVRNSVVFPFSPNEQYIVVERDGFAGVVHKGGLLEVGDDQRATTVGVFTRANGRFVTARGEPDEAWARNTGDLSERSFIDGPYIVAVVHSQRYLIGAAAAVPLAGVDERARDFARFLLPVGAFAGLLLIFALRQLLRSQQSFGAVLRGALRRNEFFLAYQPIVDLSDGRCIGAEVLMRWRNRDGELVSPEVFIPLAEQAGQITRLTARLIELMHADLDGLFARHPDFRISLNLSPQDLLRSETAERLRELIQRTGARPGNLVAEVTEHSLLDVAQARDTVAQLRSDGVLIAIDDFGTGYSSLSIMERLHVDLLKIDRSFIEPLTTQAVIGQLLPHIIEIGKTLGLRMIAEGVETEAQADYLRAQGVQYAQGWLYGRPADFAQLRKRIGD
ncbi:MAG: EAL domain-containing protein [Pseudazoarcus pumilus]|nr:EAL domain-containing protein [Pseudazoarcus pumilus]